MMLLVFVLYITIIYQFNLKKNVDRALRLYWELLVNNDFSHSRLNNYRILSMETHYLNWITA